MVYAELSDKKRPSTPSQRHDQWRNSGGGAGSTILRGPMRGGISRRYGAVKRRFGRGTIRYQEYSFKDKQPGDTRLFHTLPSFRKASAVSKRVGQVML